MSSPYQVAIDISMTDHVSGVLASIAKGMTELEGSVAHLAKSFSTLQMGIIGAATALAGGAMVTSMGHMVEKGQELVRVQQLMKLAGVSNLEVQQATAKAWEMSAKYGNISAVEALKMENDARMVFGDQLKGIHEIEPFVRSAAILKAVDPEHGAERAAGMRGEISAAMKSGEIAGKINPKDMEEHVNHMTALKIAFGEQLKIGTYLTAQRAAGVAMRNVSDDFRYGTFAALVQENGVNAGTMMMTAFNKVVAGTGWRTKAAEEGVKLGLIDPKQVEYTKDGHIKGLKSASAIKDNVVAARDPLEWVDKTLAPLFAKYTENIKDPVAKRIAEAQEMSRIFPDRNAAKFFTELLQQTQKLHKDNELSLETYKNVSKGGDAYLAANLDVQTQSFSTQWHNLMVALGSPAVPAATSALAALNSTLSNLTQFAAAHPNIAGGLIAGITALGAALTAIGVTMLGGAVISAIAAAGPIVAAIGGIAGAVVLLGGAVWAAWPQIKSFASGMINTITNLNFSDIVPKIIAKITQAVSYINAHIPEIVHAIAMAIPQIIGAILRAIPQIIGAFLKISVELVKMVPKIAIELAKLGIEIGATFLKTIKSIALEMNAAVEALPGQVAGAIKSAFVAIKDTIVSALDGIGSYVKSWVPSWMGGGEKPKTESTTPEPVVPQTKAATAPVVPTPEPVVPQTKAATAPVVPTPEPVVPQTKAATAPVVPTPGSDLMTMHKPVVPQVKAEPNVIDLQKERQKILEEQMKLPHKVEESVTPAMASAVAKANSEISALPGKVANAVTPAVAGVVTKFNTEISGIPPKVSGAITTAMAAIAAQFNAAIAGMASQLKVPAGVGKTSAPAGAAAPGVTKASYTQPPSAADGRATAKPILASQPITLHTTVVSKLDGKQVARSVTTQMVADARHPSAVGPQDTHGSWAPPSSIGVAA